MAVDEPKGDLARGRERLRLAETRPTRQAVPGATREVVRRQDLTGWPKGMRVIVRKERPHPGAQLRFTDADGLRVTAFATNSSRGQLADLELRHRRRARCEDRIRNAKDTGLTNLPFCTTPCRTRSGAPSSRWPASSPPGCRCSPCTATRPGGRNPSAFDCGCSPSPAGSPVPPDAVVLHLNRAGRWTDLLLTVITTLRNLPAPAS